MSYSGKIPQVFCVSPNKNERILGIQMWSYVHLRYIGCVMCVFLKFGPNCEAFISFKVSLKVGELMV